MIATSAPKSEEIIMDEPHAENLHKGFDQAFLQYLITLFLLIAGASLLTIAHLFQNKLSRRQNFSYFDLLHANDLLEWSHGVSPSI